MKQTTALNLLKSGKNIFITGSAGTGKTYLLRQYIQYLKERRIHPTVVAPTGIAASHLKGQTIHSFFALGIRDTVVDNGYVAFLLEKSYLKSRFSKLKVLIIDEVSMVSPEIFSSMDKVLRAFKNNPEPFGGVQVVISGDFFQLPPVSREFKEKRFAWQSPVWKSLELKSCYLEEKFRQDDNRLIFVLDEIRSGEVSQKSQSILEQCFHTELNSKLTATKLFTHNVDVDRINIEELNRLKGKSQTFKYTSKGTAKNIEKIFKTALVLEELTLKKGAMVIFIKNNPEKFYVNGTTGMVVGFENDIPVVKTSTGQKIRVVAEDWTLENDKGENVATVSQMPLRLAWAITIHKSQGMTLDAVQIDLSQTFEVGQGYVALSRIRNIEGLQLLGLNEMALKVEPLTLRIDEPIKKASMKASDEIMVYSEEELEKAHTNYMKSIGGSTNFLQIEEEKKLLRAGKSTVSSDVPTHMKTKALMQSCDSIKQIAKARGVTVATIMNHFSTLKKEDINIDLSKFKPKNLPIEAVQQAVLALEKEGSMEDFGDDGKLRYKPIFEALNGQVSYDEIRATRLFGLA
ncbi:MAG: putative helicase [uncultured Sulfurovum sp.]|uniref:Putative helicase n=1 Tax=uncultured Sulfurovum sp. TaxID=269237 RepID=A0A6S6SKC5_9BACT|nr:MAG: putative helicase [uncultured Sulfurovum sp.]